MKRRSLAWLLAAATLLSLAAAGFAADTPAADSAGEKIYRLWYDEPAAQTNSGFESQSLPLGNGYMGVNVFGGVEHELISVTENSMANPYGTGSTKGPDGDARPSSNRKGLNLMAKTYLDFDHRNVTNYSRDLILDDAIAHVQIVMA